MNKWIKGWTDKSLDGCCWCLIQCGFKTSNCCLQSACSHQRFSKLCHIHSSSLCPSLSSSALTLSCCHIIYAVYQIPFRFPFLFFKLVKDSRPYVKLEFYLICLFLKVCTYFFLIYMGEALYPFILFLENRKVLF